MFSEFSFVANNCLYPEIECGGGDKSLCQNRIGTQLSGNEVFYICDTAEKKSSRREET